MSNLNSGPPSAADHELKGEAEADLDADAILAELEAEADEDISTLREQRLQSQAQQQENGTALEFTTGITSMASAKTEDIYVTLKSDEATLQFTTEYEKAVVHFFHPDFARCATMSSHLEAIAHKHAEHGRGSEESEVHFGCVDVRDAPFVVERMGIRVLPCVIGFAKGAVKGRIVGFEGLCWDGNEKGIRVCQAVEETLVEWTLFKKAFVGKGYGDDNEDSDVSDVERRRNGDGRVAEEAYEVGNRR